MQISPGWKATIDAALKDPRCSAYDPLIKREVASYQARFGKTPGFPALDWRLFKAQLLVESGGPANPVWLTKPMQIGNPNDPAYGVLRRGAQGSTLIMSDQLKSDIATKPISMPDLNIRAAFAYIMTMAAKFRPEQIVDNPKIFHHTVLKNQSYASIARSDHTTIHDLAAENPTAGAVIHPGQVLAFQRAHMATVIVGWRQITPDFLAKYYNGGGDPLYAAKLFYVLGKLGS